jgi:hypothetical protein
VRKLQNLLAALALSLITQEAISQITNSQISRSNIVTGNNNNITSNFVNNHYYKPGDLDVLAKQLERQISIITDANAEKAFSNGDYRLSAEIWNQVFLDNVRTKKSKEILAATLTKRAISESKFDKFLALKSIEEALQIQKSNPALLELATTLSIDLHQLKSARAFLKDLVKATPIIPTDSVNRELRYNTHYRIHIIEALESSTSSITAEAIECSRIYIKEFNREEQIKHKSTQLAILQVSMAAAIQRTAIPDELFESYKQAYKIINPNRSISHISTDKPGIWISIEDRAILRIDEEKLGEKFQQSESLKDAPSYLIGEFSENLLALLSPLMNEQSELRNMTDLEGRRYFQNLYDDLIILASKCPQCGLSKSTTALGATFFATMSEVAKDYESAHFYYSLAIKRLQDSDAHFKSTNSYRGFLLKLQSKLGKSREKILSSEGTLANQNALYGPYESALKLIDLSLDFDPGNAKLISEKIKIIQYLADSQYYTLNGRKGYAICTQTHSLFEEIVNNAYILDTEVLEASWMRKQSIDIQNYTKPIKLDS